MSIGDVVEYNSETLNLPLTYTLTQNLTVFWDTVIPATDSVLPNFDTIPGGVPYLYNPIAQDTINLPDPKQSLFATMGDQVYITREMVRFSSSLVNNNPGDQPWWKTGIGGAHSYEFSKDGDVLWIGTTNGVLHRVSGLDSAYSSTAGDIDYRPETGDTIINLLQQAIQFWEVLKHWIGVQKIIVMGILMIALLLPTSYGRLLLLSVK